MLFDLLRFLVDISGLRIINGLRFISGLGIIQSWTSYTVALSHAHSWFHNGISTGLTYNHESQKDKEDECLDIQTGVNRC